MIWTPTTVCLVSLCVELGIGIVIFSAINEWHRQKRMTFIKKTAIIGKMMSAAAEHLDKNLEIMRKERDIRHGEGSGSGRQPGT